MSSGFVSGGTNEEPVEHDDEWHRVQQELEDARRQKADIGKQDGGKSLYEVLQQNKMAQQEAFEEKFKLKNQFRALDEDEVEFLDSVMESTRAQEAAVKKDTAEQLEAFRQHREEAEKAMLEDTSTDVGPPAEGEDWKIPARKRRRGKNQDLLVPGKKRKSTSEHTGPSPSQAEKETSSNVLPTEKTRETASDSVAKDPKAPGNTKPDDSKSPGKGIANKAGQTQPEAKQDAKQDAKPASLPLGLANYDSDSE